ncbi:MAG TPA: histidine kinase [Flavisolibacter sp.]
MVHIRILKWGFVVLSGAAIALVTLLTTNIDISSFQMIAMGCCFTMSSSLAWNCIELHTNRQRRNNSKSDIAPGLLKLFLFNSACILVLTTIVFISWQLAIGLEVDWRQLMKVSITGLIIAGILTTINELAYLHHERLISEKVVEHLDRELQDAEINLLKNELDPHFVYNTLMPLLYLVKTDRPTAEQFAGKLIQVYQYFLQNRNSDFIPLKEEIEFVENYFYLLRIRYKDSIHISFSQLDAIEWHMVLPFSIQLLIENAIKHNEFDQEHPLLIKIWGEKGYITVSNPTRPRSGEIYSTRTGLKNLRTRYKILCRQNLIVTEHKEQFIVKLPLNQTLKMHDQYHYHRRRSN